MENFQEWLNEQEHAVAATDSSKFVKSFMDELEKREVYYELMSTERQLKSGTIVLRFTGEHSRKFIEKSIELYRLSVKDIVRPEFEKLIWDKSFDSGTPYKISSKGTLKHKTGAGYNLTFNAETEIIKAVDFLLDNASHYLVEQLFMEKLTDYVSKPISTKFADPSFFKTQFTEEDYAKILEVKKMFPNGYHELSCHILFLACMSVIKDVPLRIGNFTAVTTDPGDRNVWVHIDKNVSEYSKTLMSVALDRITRVNKTNVTAEYSIVLNDYEMPIAENALLLKSIQENPQPVEKILRDYRGVILTNELGI